MRVDGPGEGGGLVTPETVTARLAAMTNSTEVLARADGVLGEIVLRRRHPGTGPAVYELIVNGVFLMDTAETTTEELLAELVLAHQPPPARILDRKSTRLNSSHVKISYAVFCLKKKKKQQ